MRFDLLVANTLKISRNQAAALIKQDKILLRGAVQNRPSAQISPEQSGEISAIDQIYVSRGALKLAGFLDELAENGLLASCGENLPNSAAEISKPCSGAKSADSKAAATQKAGAVTMQISSADFAATDKILGADEADKIPSATAAKIAEINTATTKSAKATTEAIRTAKTNADTAELLQTGAGKQTVEFLQTSADADTAELLQTDAGAETAEILNAAKAFKSGGKVGACRNEGGAERMQAEPSQKDILNLAGADVLDVGSSTGGFVQILLQRGAKSVTALDVGSSQLSEILRRDPRVIVRENTDIREFESKKKFDLITCDVSFISLNLILKSLASLAKSALIVLFKPQFEVGAEIKRNKKGVLKDEKAVCVARAKFEWLCAELGLATLHASACKITGKEGNREFFYLLKRMNDEI
ncbi:SAM-dependent methyltransferase [uncultured Campylobacter sp.]|uniref:SAM-dependent methyltransferase n=1 Tax=uncultured Campylobacter sp. TaxID=218934 RepID=UPI00261C8C46|nr:SAM-dependent methyltransferase [uncultured Campylobacter sp.]